MNVLMACSEVAPIVKRGPPAEMVAALAKTLSRLEHKVTIALPRLPAVEEAGLMLARRLTPLRLEHAGGTVEATLFDARLGSGVELMVIDIPGLFEGAAAPVDGDAESARRYGLYCRAIAELTLRKQRSGASFDVVHAHDWPTALVPFLLRGGGVRTALTVHDASVQGRFDKSAIDLVGLSWDDFHPDGLEFHGGLSFLKAGALAADAVAAVSPSYAEELRKPATGMGLDGVFRARSDAFVGVLNGIDYAHWSPAIDAHLVSRYDAEDVSNKGRCKASLLRELDFGLEPERPLLVALGPIDEAHGADILARALPALVKTDARVVIAGSGDERVVKMCEDAALALPGDALYVGDASEPFNHRLVAAADAVLVPSRYEPCGSWQLCAQRYGAAPVVRAVGGLKDSVVDCDAQLETGTGFVFDEPTPEALTDAAARAVAAMRTPRWAVLRRRMMRLDVSWERPARRYARLYQGS
jgi:starch synthase